MQRPKSRTQQDLLGLDPLSLASPVPQSCRAKGLFHPGSRKNQGLALSQLQKRAPLSSRAFHVNPHPMLPVRGPGIEWGGGPPLPQTAWMISGKSLSLSSSVTSLGHPGPNLQASG